MTRRRNRKPVETNQARAYQPTPYQPARQDDERERQIQEGRARMRQEQAFAALCAKAGGALDAAPVPTEGRMWRHHGQE